MSGKMDSFTATGRPFKPRTDAENAASAYDSIMASDAGGFVAGVNHLPVKFTDDSIISIPVLPKGAEQVESDKKKHFWSRRKSQNTNFIMKQMTRGEYLEHYAKDDDGKYIGSGEPAEDCILRGDDVTKYKPATTFSNTLGDSDKKDDAVVR